MTKPVNPLLIPVEELFDYQAVKAEHIVPALEQLLTETRKRVEQLSHLQEIDWDNFIEPLEYDSTPLWRAWNLVNHLNSVNNTDSIRQAYNSMLPKITEYSTWLSLNVDLFKQYKKLAGRADFKKLPAARQRIITEAIKNFKLGGVELEGEDRKRYTELSEKLAVLSQKFSLNALDAVDHWSYTETDPAQVEGLPEDAKAAAQKAAREANQEGWKFTLKMPSYLPVMQYAHSSDLRERLYRGYATIASDQGDTAYDNSETIEQILAVRQELAHILGFDNFAQMQLQTRMARSAEQVVDFLRDLAKRAKPYAEQDVAELKAFAKEKFSIHELKPWDYAYISEQLRKTRYNYSDEQIKQYLPANTVVAGLFKVIKQLFAVDFVPHKASVWNDAVQVYTITEGTELLGYLYIDLYARSGKQSGAWVADERSRHLHQDQLIVPVLYLTCNFTPPQEGQPALLRHDDVITLFHEMGHALHGLLSKVDDPAASPFASVEWDAIELPSQFMENFCWEWPVMKSLTQHWRTHEHLPKELFDKLYQAKNFQSGMQTLRQIEFALFDMLLHQNLHSLNIKEVLQTLSDVRREIAVVIPPEWNRFPHNFSHIFAGGYAAGYYSYKWAEVLSADAYSYFEEHADPQNGTLVESSGKRFKDLILAVGGSLDAAHFFKNFRGRDPDPEALLRHNGMSKHS